LVIARLVEMAHVAGSRIVPPGPVEVPIGGTINLLEVGEDPVIRRSVFAAASSDDLAGELARRGRLMLVGPMPVPAGPVLQDVERARRALGTSNYPDFAVGETLESLDLPSPDQAQLYVEEAEDAGEVSWAALLTREIVDALAADPNTRRQRLIGLAAMASRWAEALDAQDAFELEEAR